VENKKIVKVASDGDMMRYDALMELTNNLNDIESDKLKITIMM